jgi:hypothetical protein
MFAAIFEGNEVGSESYLHNRFGNLCYRNGKGDPPVAPTIYLYASGFQLSLE